MADLRFESYFRRMVAAGNNDHLVGGDNNNLFEVDGQNQRLFSFHLKTRPDLHLYLQDARWPNVRGGYYVMLLDHNNLSTSFPPPGELTIRELTEVKDFLSRLAEFINNGHFEEVVSRVEQVRAYKNYLHFKN